jgi:hypothetical protein
MLGIQEECRLFETILFRTIYAIRTTDNPRLWASHIIACYSFVLQHAHFALLDSEWSRWFVGDVGDLLAFVRNAGFFTDLEKHQIHFFVRAAARRFGITAP